MNLARWSFSHPVLVWTLTVLAALGGVLAYQGLGRLEDPAFTIKTALVQTAYPGASAAEVEEEVSERIERAVQDLPTIRRVRSQSQDGLSVVTVDLKTTVPAAAIPQAWDELRRKVGDLAGQLPPGAGTPRVIDDFGDVYGIFLALTGPDYTHAELASTARQLQRELILVRDVAKVGLFGVAPETVEVVLDPERLAELGLPPQSVLARLQAENLVADAGSVESQGLRVSLRSVGGALEPADLGELVIDAGGHRLRLRDLGTIRRSLRDPPSAILRSGGERAIGLTVSCTPDGNVVAMGAAVRARLDQLRDRDGMLPLGMELTPIAFQADDVTQAINAFLINLAAAVAIVVAVLMVFMGLRAALLIGSVLVLTILMTFIAMLPLEIALHRISLGALIIALGMLVDNAIVVVDGVLLGLRRGLKPDAAAAAVVGQTGLPLFGATAVAILAFSGIGLSPDSTGEFCGALFWVALLSLGFSWITAVTITPLLAARCLRAPVGEPAGDPLDTPFYRRWRGLLATCLRWRWAVIGAVLLVFAISLVAFGQVKQSFFPDSTRPQFAIDIRFSRSHDILATDAAALSFQQHVAGLPGVTAVHSVAGLGFPRFILTYGAEKPNPGYAQLLVDVADPTTVPSLIARIEAEARDQLPQAQVSGLAFALGPSDGGKIQARLLGRDRDQLRQAEAVVEAIFRADSALKAVRSDWGPRVPVLEVDIEPQLAATAGVSAREVAEVLRLGHQGLDVGLFRDGDQLLPIVARLGPAGRDIGQAGQLPLWSPVARAAIPLAQVAPKVGLSIDDPLIARWNRERCLIVSADPKDGPASDPFARVRPLVAAALPPGVRLEWGGEYENSRDSQAALAMPMGIALLIMFVITVALFDSLRRPLAIWACVPLALIGVAWGLLLTGQPFGFMALLGFLSLSGMLIKNAIVLIDEIETQRTAGLNPWDAVLSAGTSRLRPVMMAAATTVLGMIPLFIDAFFASMAVTIVFGLLVATVLTMVVVPVFYVTLYRIREQAP